MKITKVDIPITLGENTDGLEYIKMDKLGQIVLLAGKNGSGKTRILKKIFYTLQSKPKKGVVEKAQSQLKTLGDAIIKQEQQIEIDKKRTSTSPIWQARIQQAEERIDSYKKQIAKSEKVLAWNNIETDELQEKNTAVYFVPKRIDLFDCSQYSKNQMLNFANAVSNVGVTALPEGAFAKIQVIQDRWFNATHQHSQIPPEEQTQAIKDYEKLNELISIFLNTTIERTINDEATIFGFSLGKSQLSDGQSILLQFCMAIYSQETALKDLILILDEPENHLHPSVIIETIDRIQKCASGGQIWIATHSIPLLAHFDPSLLWYVEANKVKHAGKIPEKVLHSLLGDDNEVARLQDFISLPAQYATSRYAFECLVEPAAVMTSSDDPQSFQIRAELLKISGGNKLRVLDFGAGQGRIISNISDLEQTDQVKLLDKLEYIAYDKNGNDKEHCENAIKKILGNSENKYFNDTSQLLSVYDKKSFDVVIMCNVLHEIDPKEWLKLFLPDGLITSLLSDKGELLIVEDHQMPIGEKAYQKGFLVLDTPQLKDLFKITENDKEFTYSDKRGDGRLKAHHIPKECLSRIDEASRLASLKSLGNTAREKILEIRAKDQNYQNGKVHGFWTQQFANAQLNIAELSAT